MAIFRAELRQYRSAALLWSASLAVAIIALLPVYVSFLAGNVTELPEELSSNIMIRAMGLDLDRFFTPLGMYAFLNSFAVFAGALQAMYLGVTIFSKERMQHTGDFLFTKPYGRARIFWQKALAALCCVGLVGVSYAASSWLAMTITTRGSFDRRALILVTLSFILVQLLFLGLGFLIAAVFPRIRSALPLSAAVAFGAYVIGAYSGVVGSDLARAFSPFKYFRPSFIMAEGRLEKGYLLLSAALLLTFTAFSLRTFLKRDL